MLYIQYYIKTVHFWLKYNGFDTVRKPTKPIERGHVVDWLPIRDVTDDTLLWQRDAVDDFVVQ